MKPLINFVIGTISAFILVTGLGGVIVGTIKIIEYFIGENNSIVVAAVVISVVIGLAFTFAEYEDEKTEGESDELH